MIEVNFINSSGEGYLVIPFEYTGNIQDFIDDVLDRQKSIKEFSKTEISFYVDDEFTTKEKVILENYFEILNY
jgi:hypothetical protein